MSEDRLLKNSEANNQNPEAVMSQEQISNRNVQEADILVKKSSAEIKLLLAPALADCAEKIRQNGSQTINYEAGRALDEVRQRIEAACYQMWEHLANGNMIAQYSHRLIQQILAPEIWQLVQQQQLPADVAHYYLNVVYHRKVTDLVSDSSGGWENRTDDWLEQARGNYPGIKDVETSLAIETGRFSKRDFEKYREIIYLFTEADLLTAVEPQIESAGEESPELAKHTRISRLSSAEALIKISALAMNRASAERVKSFMQTPGLEKVFSRQAVDAFFAAVALRQEVEPLGVAAVKILNKFAYWQPIENLTRIKEELLRYKGDKRLNEKLDDLESKDSVDSVEAFLLFSEMIRKGQDVQAAILDSVHQSDSNHPEASLETLEFESRVVNRGYTDAMEIEPPAAYALFAGVPKVFRNLEDLEGVVEKFRALDKLQNRESIFKEVAQSAEKIAESLGTDVLLNWFERLSNGESISESLSAFINLVGTRDASNYKDFILHATAERLQNCTTETMQEVITVLGQDNFLKYINILSNASPEKQKSLVEVFVKIDKAPSQEIQRVKEELIAELLEVEDPGQAYEEIEKVFLQDNLPLMGKTFKIFTILHPPERIKDKELRADSPYLNNRAKMRSADTRPEAVLYQPILQDLLKVNIGSNNRSLRAYMEIISTIEQDLQSVDAGGLESLAPDVRVRVETGLRKLAVLHDQTLFGDLPASEQAGNETPGAEEELESLRQSFGVREGQPLTDRIAEMFVRPLGYKNLQEVIVAMDAARRNATERNRAFAAEGRISIQAGDLLKGVEEQYIGNIMQNGSVAKEYLGGAASSDATPLDTDVSRILPQDAEGGVRGAIESSLAKDYGDLILLVRDRGQLQEAIKNTSAATYDAQSYELFHCPTLGERHYGIRTGFPATEIDAMVVREGLIRDVARLNQIKIEIAKNGFYIPLVDRDGAVIFTAEEYAGLRQAFSGIPAFRDADGKPEYEYLAPAADSLLASDIEATKTEMLESEASVAELNINLVHSVASVLQELGIPLRDSRSGNVTGAMIIESGSTSRGTNVPGSYDFDLIVKLDITNRDKISAVVDRCRAALSIAGDAKSHALNGGGFQLRAEGARLAGSLADVDIAFITKDNADVYESQDALRDKFESIRNQPDGEEKLDEIRAQIIMAKRMLMNGGVYKKGRHEGGQGGLGGIGVENWILSSNGNLEKAINDFLTAAMAGGQLVDFDTFKQRYRIIDAGQNAMNNRHDNFIDKMDAESYALMTEVMQNYLEEMKIEKMRDTIAA